MESAPEIALQNVVESLPTRIPLLEKPNSPSPSPMKQVRRKMSYILKINSSDECPSSPHESIYEAHHLSASDESFCRYEQSQMAQLTGADATISNNENSRTVRIPTSKRSNDDVQFRYGHGTVLETITEQKSNGTMQSSVLSRSVNDLKASAPCLVHKDSVVSAQNRSPRRKHSFSLDDLSLINRSYHDACAMIERTTRERLPIHEIYASPKVPIRDPLERPPTPPGVPSWTAAQTSTPTIPRHYMHIPGKSNRIQRFLGIQPSDVVFSSRVPHPDAVRVVSAPATTSGGPTAPKFRPPKSAYAGLERHPFNNAPIARITQPRSSRKRVRFTPSATARDSSELNLRSAIESTTATALHPMASIGNMQPRLPIAQPGSVSIKSKICPHRRNSHTILTTVSDIASPANSTVHLMSGALAPAADSIPTSPVITSFPDSRDSFTNEADTDANGRAKKSKRLIPCWECILERTAKVWSQTKSCLCFVCCGFDCDYDSVEYPIYGYGLATGSGCFDSQEIVGRRMVLDQTPAAMI